MSPATVDAYGLKLPSGKLVPMTTAEKDGVLELIAEIFGMSPEAVTARVLGGGGTIVPVRITELPLNTSETE